MGASYLFVSASLKIVGPSDTNHPFFSPGSLFRNLSTLPWIQHPKKKKNTAASKALDEYVSCSRSLNDVQVDAPWPFAPIGFTEEKTQEDNNNNNNNNHNNHNNNNNNNNNHNNHNNNNVGNSEKSWDDGTNDME